ncbi:rarD protein [Pseudomonas sp. PB105]|uniref:EamA family transporter n=1 Tax=unclassified Pseudomonas TaxID=196821 RepID=UPI00131DEAFB|nr:MULTISPECIES: rarD protein [unclassified Pseudomonas]KAE9653557.1 rarD protein [Pseudomonas sp. PB105]MVW95487.1 rarD protein [Pseudomonas sp. PB100]
MNSFQKSISTYALPIILSGLANLFLGLSSLYWRSFTDVSPITLVAYRIVLSAAILAVFVCIFRKASQIKKVTTKTVFLHCIASLLIAANWGAFIWASINEHFLESGLGYLIAPFFCIAIGLVIYREKISPKKAAILLVTLGFIIALIISSKNLNHLTYLIISGTWGAYIYIKKYSSLDAVSGLFVETLFLTLGLAIAKLALNIPIMYSDELDSPSNTLILIAGAVSITPLLMLSYSTGKIPLSVTGLIQFILPITLISISTYTQKQKISDTSLALSFIFIGTLIVLVIYDAINNQPSK